MFLKSCQRTHDKEYRLYRYVTDCVINKFCFAINFFREKHDYGEIMLGFFPFMKLSDLSYGVSLLGAVLMPQNLFLHSALVLTRKNEIQT